MPSAPESVFEGGSTLLRAYTSTAASPQTSGSASAWWCSLRRPLRPKVLSACYQLPHLHAKCLKPPQRLRSEPWQH
eukprot:1728183-Pleurochrysis_carterae.AAC.2